MATVVEGVDGTVVRVRLDEWETTQALMRMITKTTEHETDTPTPIETALEPIERGTYIASQILST